MEEGKTREYQVEFTPTSRHYFFEILKYFYEIYSVDRAEQLADQLEEFAQSLNLQPNRGTQENWLSSSSKNYRFILFQRTKRADIKVIYYVDHELK